SATTSSLTQVVPSASAARFAVSTASAAVRQPAVLGSGMMSSRFSRSSTPVPPAASTRRMATVVSSVPEATRASSSTARFSAPPVPMMSREPNSRSPMRSGGSPFAGDSGRSATLDRRQHLDRPAAADLLVPARLREHRAVHGHGHALAGQRQALEQLADGQRLGELVVLAVDRDTDRDGHGGHRTPPVTDGDAVGGVAVKRCGSAAPASGTAPPSSRASVASTVSGTASMPLRPCPV